MCEIIGRKTELETLQRRFSSSQPEFIAIYGRRRIGKTFLVTRAFKDSIVFSHTGVAPVKGRKNTLKNQLQNFRFSLMRHGAEIEKDPSSWLEAFFMLEKFLELTDNGQKQVVFIDELSWMDTPRSFFTTALESFWNGWGNRRNNLVLVICSSATSWMLDNVINEGGGLYNRLTEQIHLKPFTLCECEDFFSSRKIRMTRDDVLKAYMILGGIPYYMNLFSPALSFPQNIDKLFYGNDAKLRNEFDNLFNAVFGKAELSKKIVELLGKKRSGLTRKEIAEALDINNNGEFNKLIKAIIESGYARECVTYADKEKTVLIRLTDLFCLFWLHFIKKYPTKDSNFWSMNSNTPIVNTWQGYAFEDVCFNHIPQIKEALGIAGVVTEEGTLLIRNEWETKSEGLQLDMLIWRSDNVVNLCEIKYTKEPYSIDETYSRKLISRAEKFSEMYRKYIPHITLISAKGMKFNKYSSAIQSVVSSNEIFK